MGVLELTVPWGLFHCRVNLNNSSPINTQEPLTQRPDKLFNSFIQGHKLSLTDCRHSGWCDRSTPWAAGRDALGEARCCHRTAPAPQGQTSAAPLAGSSCYPRSIPWAKEGLKWEGSRAGTATVWLWAGAATGYFCELFRGDIKMKSLSPGGTSLDQVHLLLLNALSLLEFPAKFTFPLAMDQRPQMAGYDTVPVLPFQLLLPTTQISPK